MTAVEWIVDTADYTGADRVVGEGRGWDEIDARQYASDNGGGLVRRCDQPSRHPELRAAMADGPATPSQRRREAAIVRAYARIGNTGRVGPA